MKKIYSIAKWGELFENNRSRAVKDLDWVSIPNRHDGENYTKTIQHKDGAILFSAWNLLVQVASKCKIRGILVKDNGEPHDATSLALKTRAPKLWFDKALSYFTEETDWLICKDFDPACQEPAMLLPLDCEEGKGREGKEGKGREGENGSSFPKEVEFWNANCQPLSKVIAMNDDRMRRLRQRRQDPFWVSNFENCVRRIVKSSFCTGTNKQSWRADFDWMLQPNVAAKIMEGKYDNRMAAPVGKPPSLLQQKAARL